MSNYQLKLIAIITMTIDHIGHFILDPTTDMYLMFRIVGRLAFPIFAYLLIVGYFKTSNFAKYLITILVLGLMFQLPTLYSPLINGDGNIFLTLSLGLILIYVLDANFNNILKCIAGIVLVWMFKLLNLDYGILAAIMFITYYLVQKHEFNMVNKLVIMIVPYTIYSYLYMSKLQIYGLLAIPLILIYNGERGKYINKYFFYAYYPIHILVIIYIDYLLNMA